MVTRGPKRPFEGRWSWCGLVQGETGQDDGGGSKHNSCYGDAEATRYWPCDEGLKPIPSYRGYDDPARALASNGYQVVSISANGINAQDGDSYDTGTQARGELVLAHLDLWRKWSTTGGIPFGTTYVGKVDLGNVGLMGHSRGGEGVVRAGLINLERGAPYGIRAVQPLAPVNFVRSVLPGAAMNVILPYCDGDAHNLQGQHYFDDGRYAATGDRAARSTVVAIGANHNFNTEWTPGTSTDNSTSFEDWEGAENDQPCGAKSPQRLSATEQLAVGRAYIAGFFRIELGGEKALLPLLDGSNAKPASVGRAITRVTAQAATRYDLNRLDAPLPADAIRGSVTARACAGMACVASDLVLRYPHWDVAALAPLAPIPAVTRLAWSRRDGVVRFELAALRGVDLADVRTVEFRTDRVAAGSAYVSDLAFSKPGVGSTGPIALPTLSVSDAPEIVEGDSGTKSVGFTVSMSRPSTVPVSVNAETVWYRSGEGNVVPRRLQRIVFEPGQTRLKVEVPVHANTRDGWDVSFGMVLSGAHDAVVTDAAGVGKVLDDDPEPVLTIGDGEGTEGGTIRFPMKLSAPSDKVWWFEGEFVNGTAELGKDFRSSMSPPSDPPYPVDQGEIALGQTVGWLAVPAIADGLDEPDERFQVKVTSSSGDTPKLPLTLTGVIHDAS
ncbi:hypothetical protein OG394_07800 [Kribbella sp. NBC_01245]|uniref:hypothetical protein n=1 Tax=Kribbella sp. NBC_01245 TaxID=2903578 RepID=UPI002E2ADA35|nr:hypothetical protein [Kribbella sp. NBC_01245]